jgi:plastocyanin domain-containing protein
MPVRYQEIALIQLESGFVPSEVVLVQGQPARLHITNAFGATSTFTISALGINADLRHAELTQITLAAEQLKALDGKKFTCIETGNGGTFHVVEGGKETRTVQTSGAVELAVVMTDDLAAPHSLVVKKGVPLKLYVTKTKGEEEDDTILIEAWGIKKDIEAGKVTEITITPTAAGEVTFMGVVTPSSRGTIHVID